LWQRWWGGQAGLEVLVSLSPLQGVEATLAEATVRVQAIGSGPGARMLAESGPAVLESVRSFLPVLSERRRHLRWPCLQPLSVYAVFPDLELAEPIAGMGKDLSLGGLGLLLPQAPPTPDLYVHWNGSPLLAPWAILAHVVRVQAIDEGWYEVGAAVEAGG
jgi:hypothetical protein